ncbi:7TM chemoreceptor [Cooperia oncophora]
MRLFRILMYCNVVFPALLCNEICILFVPYVLLPYPVILDLGPLRFGREMTLFYGAVLCWLAALSVLCIAYSVSLNYITVCHFWLLRSNAFFILKCIAILIPAAVIIPLSVLLPYLILNDTQSIPSMLIADPRNAVLVDKYAAMVVYLQSLGVDLCLIFLLFIYTAAAIIGSAMIIRIILRIRAKKHEFSAKTYRLHINVVVSLIMYCVILFVQVGLPVMLFVLSVFFDLSWMTRVPYLETMLFFPISLFAMSTSIMYLAVIRPYRESAIRLINRALSAIAPSTFIKIRERRKPSNSSSFTVSNNSFGREALQLNSNYSLTSVS